MGSGGARGRHVIRHARSHGNRASCGVVEATVETRRTPTVRSFSISIAREGIPGQTIVDHNKIVEEPRNGKFRQSFHIKVACEESIRECCSIRAGQDLKTVPRAIRPQQEHQHRGSNLCASIHVSLGPPSVNRRMKNESMAAIVVRQLHHHSKNALATGAEISRLVVNRVDTVSCEPARMTSARPVRAFGGANARTCASSTRNSPRTLALRRLRSPKPVLIVPGFLADASDYETLATCLNKRGLQAAVAPVRWYHWLPCLGGRSVRPVMDRVYASLVTLLYEGPDAVSTLEQDQYGWVDFAQEMADASKGAWTGGSKLIEKMPERRPLRRKASIVGHSAGGWISRIMLGDLPYGEYSYDAARYADRLITLGTPHTSVDGITKKNLDFVNLNYPGAFEDGVNYVCVAGRAVRGSTKGVLRDFAYQSYELCCGSGEVWGDGVTPEECALALEDALVQKVVLEDVFHSPTAEKTGRLWYGSEDVLDSWTEYLF